MSNESIEFLGQLVVNQVMQKNMEERCQVVNKIFDALYEPYVPKNEKLERLIGFLRDMYDGLDEATTKSLTLKIQQICMDVRTKYDSKDTNNTAPLIADNINKASFANTCRIVGGQNRKIDKAVRIKVGSLCGTIGHVNDVLRNDVLVTLADGRIVRYTVKHIEFLE